MAEEINITSASINHLALKKTENTGNKSPRLLQDTMDITKHDLKMEVLLVRRTLNISEEASNSQTVQIENQAYTQSVQATSNEKIKRQQRLIK